MRISFFLEVPLISVVLLAVTFEDPRKHFSFSFARGNCSQLRCSGQLSNELSSAQSSWTLSQSDLHGGGADWGRIHGGRYNRQRNGTRWGEQWDLNFDKNFDSSVAAWWDVLCWRGFGTCVKLYPRLLQTVRVSSSHFGPVDISEVANFLAL